MESWGECSIMPSPDRILPLWDVLTRFYRHRWKEIFRQMHPRHIVSHCIREASIHIRHITSQYLHLWGQYPHSCHITSQYLHLWGQYQLILQWNIQQSIQSSHHTPSKYLHLWGQYLHLHHSIWNLHSWYIPHPFHSIRVSASAWRVSTSTSHSTKVSASMRQVCTFITLHHNIHIDCFVSLLHWNFVVQVHHIQSWEDVEIIWSLCRFPTSTDKSIFWLGDVWWGLTSPQWPVWREHT